MGKRAKDKEAWKAFKQELMTQVGQGILILPVLAKAMLSKLDKEGNVVGELTDDEHTGDSALGRTAALNYMARDLASGAKGTAKERLEVLIPLIGTVYEKEIGPDELSKILDASMAKLAPELVDDDPDDGSGGLLN